MSRHGGSKFCGGGNSGNGVNVDGAASHDMADGLSYLARKGSHSMSTTNTGGNNQESKTLPKRTPTTRARRVAVTAMEALQLLESAVNYCQSAGLTVRAGNVPNLVLSIDGAVLDGDPPHFVLANLPLEAAPADEALQQVRPVRSRL